MTDAYYRDLTGALRTAGLFKPTLVIDRDRLDANADDILARWPRGKVLRLVDKSLAIPALIARLMERCSTRSIMTFHLPIALAMLRQFPDANLLFGKPMPAPALETFLARSERSVIEDFAARCVLLVDSRERMAAYAALAALHDIGFRIAFEVDVGLHRGGLTNPEALSDALDALASMRGLTLEGIMGYEAHISAIPGFAGGPEAERERVAERLEAFVAVLPPESRTLINSGGSHTALRLTDESTPNDLSIGSGFLLPTDFERDLPFLEPALFIATPILKIIETELPGPKTLSRLMSLLGQVPKKACYLYGGKWMAKPVFPPDMHELTLWGGSSNQQIMGLGRDTSARVDDFAILRPTQSESVLQQFGPVAVYSGGLIVDFWEPLAPG